MTIVRNGKTEGTDPLDAGRCSGCGVQLGAGSFWRGHRDVVFCTTCALTEDILPVLLADAVLALDPQRAQAALDHFMAQYWRAIALGLLRGKS